MKDDRYQYQPWYIKLWRRRYYIPTPFIALYSKLRYGGDFATIFDVEIGMAECRMKWYYTSEELKTMLKEWDKQ